MQFVCTSIQPIGDDQNHLSIPDITMPKFFMWNTFSQIPYTKVIKAMNLNINQQDLDNYKYL